MSLLLTSLSPQQLRRAADLKDKIQSLENEFQRILGTSTKSITAVAPKKKRKMSAAGRAKIAAAARARWAKFKGRKAAAKPIKKARRKMSAAARAKIAAAARARWKTAKAQGKNSL
jgi:methionyl-tRNA synthetase